MRQRAKRYERVALHNDDELSSDLVEIELKIDLRKDPTLTWSIFLLAILDET